MQFPHVIASLDLESLGLGQHARVISFGIATAVWDPQRLAYRALSTYTNFIGASAGGSKEKDTVEWWEGAAAKYPKAYSLYSRALKYDAADPILHLKEAIDDVHRLAKSLTGDPDAKVHWMGNGPEFDMTLLQSLCNRCDYPYPLDFRNQGSVRDFSFLRKLISSVAPEHAYDRPDIGEYLHCPLADAMYELDLVIRTVDKVMSAIQDQPTKPREFLEVYTGKQLDHEVMIR